MEQRWICLGCRGKKKGLWGSAHTRQVCSPSALSSPSPPWPQPVLQGTTRTCFMNLPVFLKAAFNQQLLKRPRSSLFFLEEAEPH